MRTLVIGDAHADPRHDNRRFTALGNFILEQRPENIVNIGDWGSYDSITFHTSGKPLLREGMRLADDVAAAKDALARAEKATIAYNERQSKNRKAQYKPQKFWLNGNHEDRIWRNWQIYPEFLGLVNHNDPAGAEKYGWNIIPYRGYANIDNTLFTHVPANKRSSIPISGEYVAKKAVELHGRNIVFGHTHRFLVHDLRQIGTTNVVYGVNCGWFGEETPDYIAVEENLDWWSGLVMLTHYAPGQIAIQTFPVEMILNGYL